MGRGANLQRTTVNHQVVFQPEVNVEHLRAQQAASALRKRWDARENGSTACDMWLKTVGWRSVWGGALVSHPADGVELLLALDRPARRFLDVEHCTETGAPSRHVSLRKCIEHRKPKVGGKNRHCRSHVAGAIHRDTRTPLVGPMRLGCGDRCDGTQDGGRGLTVNEPSTIAAYPRFRHVQAQLREMLHHLRSRDHAG